MEEKEKEQKCLNCGSNSNNVVLLVCEYKGQERRVCVRCLPTLIHGAH